MSDEAKFIEAMEELYRESPYVATAVRKLDYCKGRPNSDYSALDAAIEIIKVQHESLKRLHIRGAVPVLSLAEKHGIKLPI